MTSFYILLIIQSGTEQGIDVFLESLPFNGTLWSSLLTFFGLVTAVGMAGNWRGAVGTGSLVSFCLWVFGAISFVTIGEGPTVVLLLAPFLLFFAYLFLGATIRDRNQA